MFDAFFVSDLHGRASRYRALEAAIVREAPRAVFFGGDLLPSPIAALAHDVLDPSDFVDDVIGAGLLRARDALGARYPSVFVIPGNDDAGADVVRFETLERAGLVHCAHARALPLGAFRVYGYGCVPPTPFALKDWERYDVSRFLDPGALAPEEGFHTVPFEPHAIRLATIARDLEVLAKDDDLARAVFLFHAPPHGTCLDRAALDGKMVDHVPLDVHVGSIAIRRFILRRQPWLTLHGHVHESARLTGSWRTTLSRTIALGAAHDGPELALVRVDLDAPDTATRELIPVED